MDKTIEELQAENDILRKKIISLQYNLKVIREELRLSMSRTGRYAREVAAKEVENMRLKDTLREVKVGRAP